MLTAVFLAAVVVASAHGAAAEPQREWVYAIEARALEPDAPPELSLVRLDARTLRLSARRRYDRAYGSPRDWAKSPEGRRIAVVDWSGEVRFFELSRLQPIGVPVAEFSVQRVAWVSSTRVIAIGYRRRSPVQAAVAWIDVRTSSVTRILDVGGLVTDFVRGRGDALVVTVEMPSHRGRPMAGAAQRLLRIGARDARQIASFGGIRVAIEPWRVTRAAPLPPLAVASVEQARQDLARREGVPTQSIELRAIVALRQSRSLPGYRLVFRLGGKFVEYVTSVLVERREVVAVSDPHAWSDVEPDLKKHDLLRLPVGAWHVQQAALITNRAATRAYLVTSGRALAVADLAGGVVRIRTVRRPGGPWPFRPRPARVGAEAAAWQIERDGGIAFLDLQTGMLRVVPFRGCNQEPASDLLLVYGGGCRALTAFGADGAVRRELLREITLNWVQASAAFAYAWESGAYARKVTVVDLRTRRVVRRTTLRNVTLLVGSTEW